MKRCVNLVARRNVLTQGTRRSVQIERKDLDNKHSIVKAKEENPYLTNILAGNKKWVDSKKLENPEFFNQLAQPQKPRYLYFGCSDSRVPANQILGLK